MIAKRNFSNLIMGRTVRRCKKNADVRLPNIWILDKNEWHFDK